MATKQIKNKKKEYKVRDTFKLAEKVSKITMSIPWLRADIENLRLADNLMKKMSEVRTNELSYHK